MRIGIISKNEKSYVKCNPRIRRVFLANYLLAMGDHRKVIRHHFRFLGKDNRADTSGDEPDFPGDLFPKGPRHRIHANIRERVSRDC